MVYHGIHTHGLQSYAQTHMCGISRNEGISCTEGISAEWWGGGAEGTNQQLRLSEHLLSIITVEG